MIAKKSKTKAKKPVRLAQIERLVFDDPMAAAERCQGQFKELRDSQRSRRCELVLESFVVAKALTQDPAQWIEFLHHPFWATSGISVKSKKHQVDNVARCVMIFVKQAKSGIARKRAYKYGTAIAPFLEQNATVAIMKKALDGGIEKLIRRATEKKRKAKRQQADVAEADEKASDNGKSFRICVSQDLFDRAIGSRVGQKLKIWVHFSPTPGDSNCFRAYKITRLR